ncbi:hypothetical protein [Paludisphaera mucosa]|uniref:Uncharacterized protein n=1 Tax=Paludisphaera mucosa TaxID=3030827 RepID=A0ABT6F9E2_9BACT|nr:hypothetical protein [Paludisphaera mucosa]MDG3004142.1 hypothetical protein [Paludisphaera mucosa]
MKRRLVKFLKWAAIATGLLLAGFFLWSAWYTRVTARRLEERLAAIPRPGEPLSIADFARIAIPPEVDADVPLRRADVDLEFAHKEFLASFPDGAAAIGTLPTERREKLAGLFRKYPGLVPLLKEAAARPDYNPPLDVTLPSSNFALTLMTRCEKHRRIARILQAWSALLVAEGRADEALDAQIDALRLARHARRLPTLTAYFTSIACARVAMKAASEVLQSATVSGEAHRRLDAELTDHDGLEPVRQALKNERAFSLTSAAEMSNNLFWLRGWMRNNLVLMFLDLYEEQLRRSEIPYPKLRSTPARSSLDGYRHPLKVLAELLEPAMTLLRESAERQRAAVRSLRVLNALLARTPADAPAPADLVALGLPPEATLDPFTDEPLIVKKGPAGWLIYSVGQNLVDDGGTLTKDKDVGWASSRRNDPEAP